MNVVSQPKSDPLRRIYWRDEILELLFWIEGEGLGSAVDLDVLDRFLGRESEIAILHLEPMVEAGYLEHTPSGAYRLTAHGRSEGRRLFADEFSSTHRPARGPCGSECWCRRLGAEAEACARGRESATW